MLAENVSTTQAIDAVLKLNLDDFNTQTLFN